MPKGKITNVSGKGNNDGGHVSVSGKVIHKINDSTSIEVNGNVNRSQSFKGHGGQTNWGGTIGINKKF